MNETTYSLEWRGTRKSGLSYADIESGLVSGELHSLYKIHVNGKWIVLRDFVEQQRALPPAPAAEQISPTPSSFQPGSPSAVPPPAPLGKAVPPTPILPIPSPSTRAKAPKPVWFWPAIIISSTVVLLLVIVLAYMRATSRTGGQRSGSSVPTSSAKPSHSTDAPREKSTPSTATTDHNLTNEEIADLKSPYVAKINTLWLQPGKDGKEEVTGSSGSGVLIKHENGYAYFVTNRHVVSMPENAKEPKFSLNFRGKNHSFEVVKQGRYELDLAMLRIEYSDEANQPPLRSARLEDLKAGQECVAIGNALGGGISVTTGVISAFDDWGEGKFVRTSAPISSGNSGGGLFRTKDGALIGITTMASTSSQTEAVQNINLAIPMDYVLSDLFWEKF